MGFRFIVPVLLLCTANVFAQEDIYSNGLETGIGARAIGMGGAYSAVGEDYSASYWNPAALAQIRRFELSGGLSHFIRKNDASFGNVTIQSDETFTKLTDLGIVYPVPTYRGSLVFAFGYNRVRTYDSNMEFSFFDATPGDSVEYKWREQDLGTMNFWNAAAAVDLSPNFSVGMGLNFWSGGSDYSFSKKETDIYDIWFEDEWRNDQSINSNFSAFNMSLGALFRVNNQLRLAANMVTPKTLTVTEQWSEKGSVIDDDGYSSLMYDENGDPIDYSGDFEYKLRTPFSFTLGAAYNLAGMMLSGQMEFNDWQQLRFETEPPISGTTREQANDFIHENYRSTTRVRLGAEFTLPGMGTQLRAGYFLDPSIYENAESDEDRKVYSFGLGFLLDKQLKLDIAYQFGNWKHYSVDPFGADANARVTSLQEDIKYKKLFATLSYRL
ncbi:MAG: outer membrane protein transport protein [Deferribacteres bacterium]|nr:outer membrane protein transport protein [candidate division KSB1 bacterium]MCB9500752.1 outer membrane protein transport protein [Deferribacteres bacterium]